MTRLAAATLVAGAGTNVFAVDGHDSYLSAFIGVGAMDLTINGKKLKSERVPSLTWPVANCCVIRSVTRKMFRVCS